MPIPDLLRYAVAAALCGVLLWAAISDIVSRLIPNRAVLAILALFVAWAAINQGAGLVSGLAAAAIGLAVGYGFYAFKIMGGGDAKLFAATALFIGLAYLPAFAFATVMTGGVMAIASLAARPRRAAAMLTTFGKGDQGRGIPYGVAIAIGGAYVLWGSLLGNIAPFSLPHR